MYFLTYITQAGGQHHLHLGMNIFHTRLQYQFSFQGLLVELIQSSQQFYGLILPDQSRFGQHDGMGHGTHYIVRGQLQII